MKKFKEHLAFVLSDPATKGGVTKTTSLLSIASEFASLGYKTLLIDNDPQGNASSNLGIKDNESSYIGDLLLGNVDIIDIIKPTKMDNLYAIPSNLNLIEVDKILHQAQFYSKSNLCDYLSDLGIELDINQSNLLPEYDDIHLTLKNALEPILSEFDFILIDTPPYYNSLVENALYASDYFFVPVGLDKFALEGFEYIMNKVEKIKSNGHSLELLGVIPSKYRKSKLHNLVLENIQNEIDTHVFKPIPHSVKVEEAPFYEMTLREYKPSILPTLIYAEIARELISMIKARNNID